MNVWSQLDKIQPFHSTFISDCETKKKTLFSTLFLFLSDNLSNLIYDHTYLMAIIITMYDHKNSHQSIENTFNTRSNKSKSGKLEHVDIFISFDLES